MSPQKVKEESKLSRRMADRQHDTALFRVRVFMLVFRNDDGYRSVPLWSRSGSKIARSSL